MKDIKSKIDIIKKNIPPNGYRKFGNFIFPSNWQLKKIIDICPMQRGFDLTTVDVIDGEYPVAYSNGVLRKHYEFKVEGPGVFTGRSGTIGKVFYIEENYWPHNTSLWITNFCGNVPKFIYYLLNHIDLAKFSTGTGVPTLNRNDVHAHKMPIPPHHEQQQIAEILSIWDKAIELKEKLIEEKKNQKTGLMQKLLTGKVRLSGFDEKWKEVSLGDIMKNKTVKTTENDQHQILSCTKDGVVSQSEHFNKQIASTNNIGYKILKKGEVVLSPMNLWLGGIDISNFNIGIVSPAYKVYQVNYSVIGENYLRNLLRSEYMLGLYDSISQKGASTVRRNLSIKDFEALRIKIPNDFEEMNAIDKVLYISAREIELLSSELEYLKEQKKGLMQLLLTGIVRVNTQEN